MITRLDQDVLKEFGAAKGIEWNFTTPDGPWRNGCSESLTKSIKEAISYAIGDQVLYITEFQTVCFEKIQSKTIYNDRATCTTSYSYHTYRRERYRTNVILAGESCDENI